MGVEALDIPMAQIHRINPVKKVRHAEIPRAEGLLLPITERCATSRNRAKSKHSCGLVCRIELERSLVVGITNCDDVPLDLTHRSVGCFCFNHIEKMIDADPSLGIAGYGLRAVLFEDLQGW